MSNPGKQIYRLNTEKIVELLIDNEMTQEQLAWKAGISKTTMSKGMNGECVSMRTISKIAKALKHEGNIRLFIRPSETRDEAVLENSENVLTLTSSSFTIDDAISILAVLRKAAKDKRELVIKYTPAVIALFCFLAGLAPIDARWIFIAGMALSAFCIAVCVSKKSLIAATPLAKFFIVLPLAAMALNLTAYIAWPHAIGIFPVKGGYTFGFGDRQPGWLSTKPMKRFYPVTFSPRLEVNEIAELSADPDSEEWASIHGDKSGLSVLCYVELETGANTVSMRRRGITEKLSFYIHPNNEFTYIDTKLTKLYNNRVKPNKNNDSPISFSFDGIPAPQSTQFRVEPQNGQIVVFPTFVHVIFLRKNVAVVPENMTLVLGNETSDSNGTIQLDKKTQGFYSMAGPRTIILLHADKIENECMFRVYE